MYYACMPAARMHVCSTCALYACIGPIEILEDDVGVRTLLIRRYTPTRRAFEVVPLVDLGEGDGEGQVRGVRLVQGSGWKVKVR